MKGLYIRFYVNANSEIPYISHCIGDCSLTMEKQTEKMKEHSDAMIDWMNRHPDGKVDFAWR